MKGFSLVELLVAVAVMATLTVILVPRFRSFSADQGLKNATLQLQSQIKVVQNNAISAIKCNASTASSNWALEFTGTNSYSTYPTCSGSGTPSQINYNLPQNVSIIGWQAGENCDIPRIITFSNISGLVKFTYSGEIDSERNCLDESGADLMTITLKLNSNNKETKVFVSKGGAIYTDISSL